MALKLEKWKIFLNNLIADCLSENFPKKEYSENATKYKRVIDCLYSVMKKLPEFKNLNNKIWVKILVV